MNTRRILPAFLFVALLFSLQSVGAPSSEKRGFRDRGQSGRVTVCHCSGKKKDKCRSITIGAPAVGAHLAHGDTIGPCIERETACCLPDECRDQVRPDECRRMGGAPFGLCAACADVTCPNAGCIGATGSCSEAHETPGRDFLYCCDQICLTKPSCCEVAWTEECATTLCRITTDETPCCSPDGACHPTSGSLCTGNGGVRVGECAGDADGDGIDDACVCSSP